MKLRRFLHDLSANYADEVKFRKAYPDAGRWVRSDGTVATPLEVALIISRMATPYKGFSWRLMTIVIYAVQWAGIAVRYWREAAIALALVTVGLWFGALIAERDAVITANLEARLDAADAADAEAEADRAAADAEYKARYGDL